MNKKKSIWSGVSVLIAAVLAIVAFVRSDTQIWLLTAAFTIWAIWVTAAFVFPYIQEQENEKRRAARPQGGWLASLTLVRCKPRPRG